MLGGVVVCWGWRPSEEMVTVFGAVASMSVASRRRLFVCLLEIQETGLERICNRFAIENRSPG
jgi:hypothetical protein